MKNFDLKLKIEKDGDKDLLVELKNPMYRYKRHAPPKKDILINNEKFILKYGAQCLWAHKKNESFGIKFHILHCWVPSWSRNHPGRRGKKHKIYLSPESLVRTKEIYKIQKILFDYNLSTEPKEIVTCSINNGQVGYSVIMERAIPIDTASRPRILPLETVGAWWKSFIKVIEENNIIFYRKKKLLTHDSRQWGYPKQMQKEIRNGHNLIKTKKGYRLIDLQEAHFVD